MGSKYEYLSCGAKDDAITLHLSIELKSFQSIIEVGIVPSDLANYEKMRESIFSRYTAGVTVVVRYVITNGNGNGSF